MQTSNDTKVADRPRQLFERRPAPVLFVTTGTLLAGVVQQPLPDVLPDRLGTVKPDRVDILDFHGPSAAAAGDSQHVALDLG
jgi:hypothetical protein